MFFQINVTPKEKKPPKAKKDDDEEQIRPQENFELVLAPFQPQTHIKLDTNVYNSVKCSLNVRNPSNRNLNVTITKTPPAERFVVLSTSELSVPAESSAQFEISWTPQESGSWRDTLQLTDSRRIKYDVAIVTIARGVKKSVKGRSRILGPANTNKNAIERKIVPSSRESKKTHTSNNVVQSNVPSKRPRLNNAQPSNKENSTKHGGWTYESYEYQKTTTFSQISHDYSTIMSSTKFNLTPLKTHNELPQSKFTSSSMIDFEPQNIAAKSPEIPKLPERIRRETYDTATVGKSSNNCQQSHEFSVIMNSTNFNFTPIKQRITENLKQPANLQFIDEKNIVFSPQEIGIVSPEITNMPILRRETYVTSKNYENFAESPSPKPETPDKNNIADKSKPSEFSLFINDINLRTPNGPNCTELLVFSPRRCSTGNRTKSMACESIKDDSSLNLAVNNTFDVSNSKIVDNSCANETYKLSKSPKGTRQLDSLKPTRLSRSFSRDSTLETNITIDSMMMKNSCSAFSSTPVCRDAIFKRNEYTTRPSFSHSMNQRNYDDASVKEVLEADLWVKSDEEQSSSSSIFVKKRCNSLDRINEEIHLKNPVFMKNLEKMKTLPAGKNEKFTKFRRIEISPPKKKSTKSDNTRRVSPTKSTKIRKEKNVTETVANFRKKVQMNCSMKRGKVTIPGVRMANLSLAGINRSNAKDKCTKDDVKEISVKLHDPNDFLLRFCNPDPFGATMTQDPFLTSTLYYDDKWMWHQEMEFKKWLNALLTPPEHLNADVDTLRVDVGKVWQSCRNRDDVALAETREAVSARYHTNTRLNTLRKAACAMFRRDEVEVALTKATLCVERGTLMVRQDRDLYRDIGLQKEILELFLSYNPLWLRIGLETIYGETIPLHSNNDLVGLTRFIITRFFSDPFIVKTHSHATISSLKLPTFTLHMNKFILKKFLLIVYFLDYAKRNKLIGHDPCLFHKLAEHKESRSILLTFSREVLSGVGDLTKILRTHGYVVTHKQTYLDEYDYAVKDISTDLRDGVRLCRVMELITGDRMLTGRCRVPAISRLQKVHNVDLSLTALLRCGYNLTGDIDAKSVADGHREKTLSLLWQIIYKYQAPRFDKAAKIVQKWWRSRLWYVRIRYFLRKRRDYAAATIQRAWKCYRARKIVDELRAERKRKWAEKEEAVRVIQIQWIRRMAMLRDRRNFVAKRNAAKCLQRWFRRRRDTATFVSEFRVKRQAVIIIQNHWRARILAIRDRESYRRLLNSSVKIQIWWRAKREARQAQRKYETLRKATIFVQSRWRAIRSMRIARDTFEKKLHAIKAIQTWWRRYLVLKRDRNNYLLKKTAVRSIENWLIDRKYVIIEKNNFKTKRNAAIIIQRNYRKYLQTRDHVKQFRETTRACRIIQQWWKSVRIVKRYRIVKNSCGIIQRWWRGARLMKSTRDSFENLRRATIIVQKNWRTKKCRRSYVQTKLAVSTIESWYKNVLLTRSIRCEFRTKKSATVKIQNWWRYLQISRKQRCEYLEYRQMIIIVQKKWRSIVLGRKTRLNYLATRSDIVRIQATWRMLRERRMYRDLLKRHEAARILQNRWRARKKCIVNRKNFLAIREATIKIQHLYRSRQKGRQTRREYMKIRSAILKIQIKWRANRSMKEAKKQFLRYRRAAIVLQSKWRMIRERRNYRKMKNAILTIQTKWRAVIIARKQRSNYETLRRSILFLQRRYRANKLGKIQQLEYEKMRQKIIWIQRVWRKKLEYRMRDEAAINIQTWWKSIIAMRECKKYYQSKRLAALVVQRRYRARKIASEARQEYLRIVGSIVKIQRGWRSFVRKKLHDKWLRDCKIAVSSIERWWIVILRKKRLREAKLAKLKREYDAATSIQCYWRGYVVRKRECSMMKELRVRSERAAKAAVPSATVAFQLRESMDMLLVCETIGQLSMCLTSIDTLTRLSLKGCIAFCEMNLVDKIYWTIAKSNRSSPWLDVCLRCTSILITLAKLQDTKKYVYRVEFIETLARLMTVSIEHHVNLFLHLSTLLWLLSDNPEYAKAISGCSRTTWLLSNLDVTISKKKNNRLSVGNINKSRAKELTAQLPNSKPDWGIKNRRPRLFTTVHHAITSLIKRLKIDTAT